MLEIPRLDEYRDFDALQCDQCNRDISQQDSGQQRGDQVRRNLPSRWRRRTILSGLALVSPMKTWHGCRSPLVIAEFAPIAALETASIPHEFPVVYIYLREETTDRVARVAFRDAESSAGRYLAGDEGAVDEMRAALIWH